MTFEKLSVPIAIVVAGALIAGALYYSNMQSAKQVSRTNSNTTQNVTSDMMPVSSEDHILGNPNAEVIIVEYSDTECPYCKAYHSTLRRVMNEYGSTGKVAWVYRHFPIDSLHSRARKEAEALECANELGGSQKFWEYTNTLYEVTNSNDSLDPQELPKIAKSVGLNEKDFNACLASGRHADKIQAHYDDAIKAGGRGTPHTVLVASDGTHTAIQGALPYESLKATLDAFFK